MNNYRPLFNRTTPFTGLTVILLAACSGSGSSGLGSRSVSTSAIREDELANARNIILSGDYDFQSLDGDHADFFEITENNMLRFKGREVSDERESYTITVSAINNETGAEEEFTLSLNVQDINDVAPEFNPDNVSPADFDDDDNVNLDVTENTRFSQSFAATPDVAGDTVTYELSGADEALFEVDEDGIVTSLEATQFDAESGKSTYNFTVTARVGDLAQAQEVILIVTDINDSAPVFTQGATSISIDEEDDFSTAAYQATSDTGDDIVSYSLTGTDASAFVIDSATGVLRLATTTNLDASEKSTYSFTILATVTADGETQTAERAVTVTVTDGAPAFGDVETNLTVDENGALAATSFAATLKEAGQTVTYSLRDGDQALFEIDSDGNLTSKTDTMFDHESGKTSYSFTVVATAGGKEATRAVTVTVTDINDVAPTITSGATASALVEGTEIAATEAVYTATGTFDIDAIVWSLGGTDSVLFDIDDRTGAVTFKTDTTPDHEAKASYSFEVVATSGTHEVTQIVTIEVTDLNDSAPVFTAGATSISIDEEDDFSTPAYQATPDKAGDRVSYSLDEDGDDAAAFVIDSATGELTLAATTNLDASETSTYDFTVLATVTSDGETQTAKRNVTVTVTDGAPAFGAVETNLTVDENGALAATSFAATPKEAGQTVTYSLRDGDHALFAISDNGQVTSKTNTVFDHESGKTSYSFTVVATANTDDGDREATRAVSVTVTDINDVRPTITTDPAALTIAEDADAITGTLVTFTADTDDAASSTRFAFADGDTDNGLFNLTDEGALSFKTAPNITQDTTYNVQVMATSTDGENELVSAPFTYTVMVTNLNPALSLDPNSGFNPEVHYSDATLLSTLSETGLGLYSITLDDDRFEIREATGSQPKRTLWIKQGAEFDHEAGESVTITLTATMTGAPDLTAIYTLTLTDINDEAPVFLSDGTYSLTEGTTVTTDDSVGLVMATGDIDEAVTYRIKDNGTADDGDLFRLGLHEILVEDGTRVRAINLHFKDSVTPDYETKDSYSLTIIAASFDDASLTSEQLVTISVTDIIDDIITGDGSANVLYAGKGEDRLIGHGGADRLYGEQGADVLEGGAGADVLYGGRGDDSLYGDAGNDELYGGEGNDILDGGAGDDIIDGGTGGSDAVSYAEESAGVTVNLATGTATDGSGGTDRLRNIDDVIGSDHDDVITGDDTDNDLYGGDGDDTITSGAGGFSGDVIVGGKGDDTITLGADRQTLIYHYNSTDGLTIDKRFIDGFDTVYNFTIGEDSLLIIDENQDGNATLRTLIATGLTLHFVPAGTSYTEMIWRTADSQQMIFNFTTPITGTLADEITAAGTVIPGTNALTITSEDAALAILTKLFTSTGHADPSAGDLFEVELATIDLVLDEADGTENTTTGYLEIDGGAGDDDITGSAGADSIDGRAGDDEIAGGAGDDEIYGGSGNDDIYGDAGDDYLIGEAGDDDIYGGAGHDEIYGEGGDDDIYGGAGDDQIEGNEGDDYIAGGAGHDEIYGNAGADEIYGGDGDDDLYGGAGADEIYGGSGADYLYSEGGADLLDGGRGDDDIFLDDDAQTVIYRINSSDAGLDFVGGNDAISDFTRGEDIFRIIDENGGGVTSLDALLSALAGNGNSFSFFANDDDDFTELALLDPRGNDESNGFSIVFANLITGTDATTLAGYLDADNQVAASNTEAVKAIFAHIFSSDGSTLDLFEVGVDVI